MRYKFFTNLVQAFWITAVGLLLAVTSLHRILNILDFTQSMNGTDFQMSDVYNNVADSRSVRSMNSEVVIVPLDGYGRREIADIIRTINLLDPKAIGLDVVFTEEYDGDEYLIDVIKSTPNIVLPLALEEETCSCMGSYFYDVIDDSHYGVINLDASASNQCVRTYHPIYQFNGLTINSFATEITSMVKGKSISYVRANENKTEIISYPSVEFPIVEVKDLMMHQDEVERMIQDKIVLIGDIYNTSDFHLTPICAGMPGIVIHAHIIDTIMSGKCITTTSKPIGWLIAFIICYLFMCIKLFVRDYSYKLGLLVMRVIQMLCLYVLFMVGCKMFVNQLIYVDFAPTLLMITLAVFTYDIWTGAITLIKIIFKKDSI